MHPGGVGRLKQHEVMPWRALKVVKNDMNHSGTGGENNSVPLLETSLYPLQEVTSFSRASLSLLVMTAFAGAAKANTEGGRPPSSS